MQSASPITHDGVLYDRLAVNLAVTSSYNASGTRDMSIALRVIPTAVTAGGVRTLDAQANTVYRGSLAELHGQSEQTCVEAMTAALAAFIESRGW